MDFNYNIEGLDELLKKIGELTLRKTLDKSIKKSIFLAEREAKLRTPVDTGLLRNSYEAQFRPLEGVLRNFREYAPYVEGRVGFMRDTSEFITPRIEKIFADDIQDLINELVK